MLSDYEGSNEDLDISYSDSSISNMGFLILLFIIYYFYYLIFFFLKLKDGMNPFI